MNSNDTHGCNYLCYLYYSCMFHHLHNGHVPREHILPINCSILFFFENYHLQALKSNGLFHLDFPIKQQFWHTNLEFWCYESLKVIHKFEYFMSKNA